MDLMETICETEDLNIEKQSLKEEMAAIVDQISKNIHDFGTKSQDRDTFSKKDYALRKLYAEKQEKREAVEAEIQERNDRREFITHFLSDLREVEGTQTEFREELWAGCLTTLRSRKTAVTRRCSGAV